MEFSTRSGFQTMEVKSVGTFPVILVKLVTLPFHPKQSWILNTMGGNESFFGHNIPVGGGGGGKGGDMRTMGWTPKPIKIFSLGTESYVTIITWKGFFTQSQVLVILSM